MHWETQKNSYDLLYFNIHFIVVIWNQAHNIYGVSLIYC